MHQRSTFWAPLKFAQSFSCVALRGTAWLVRMGDAASNSATADRLRGAPGHLRPGARRAGMFSWSSRRRAPGLQRPGAVRRLRLLATLVTELGRL
jgi:hypothetical protein